MIAHEIDYLKSVLECCKHYNFELLLHVIRHSHYIIENKCVATALGVIPHTTSRALNLQGTRPHPVIKSLFRFEKGQYNLQFVFPSTLELKLQKERFHTNNGIIRKQNTTRNSYSLLH